MENTGDLAKDILESEVEFRAQFDKDSQFYHNGDPTPVPIGGQKVPESMENEIYPANIDPAEYLSAQGPAEDEYGPEYKEITDLRQVFLGLKKHIANLTKVLEAILRHKEIFAKKGNENNEEHLSTFQKNMATEVQKLTEEKNVILPLVEEIERSEFADRYNGFRDMLNRAENDFKNKEDLGEFFLNLKKFNENSFNDAQKLMDRLKKIKKDFAANKKPEQSTRTADSVVPEEEKKSE